MDNTGRTREEALAEVGSASLEYHAVCRFIKENGYSPTLDEIMRITHRGSKQTTTKNIKKLIGIGLLQGELRKKRTLRVSGYTYQDMDDGTMRYYEKYKEITNGSDKDK